jgi:1-deoxy-D-xylulose-5-phosphate reductoisomerase
MTKLKSVTILGATGSVGQSTLDLIGRTPEKFVVEAVTAHSDVEGLAKSARATSAKFAVIADPDRLHDLKAALSGTNIEVGAGEDAVIEAARRGADWTMAAIVGCAGLKPVMAALEGGKTLAFANKEALVSAGSIMIDAARRSGATLLPVDSEHNAIFQCLDQSAPKGVHRIVLTASGGPFRMTPLDEMARATPAQAVAHPNWSMGAKISVDSATMMNKGLELIEAHHLFAMPADRLDVVIHPQSVIHSMVEYADGSVLAQLGPTDMRIPIAHTLAWPERMDTPCERLDLAAVGRLDFMAPDYVRFPALKLARDVMVAGGPAPAIMNAANEIAVAAFLDGAIAFGEIANIVARVLERYVPDDPVSLADVLAIDSEARRIASALLESVVA